MAASSTSTRSARNSALLDLEPETIATQTTPKIAFESPITPEAKEKVPPWRKGSVAQDWRKQLPSHSMNRQTMGLKWHHDWPKNDAISGRVLIIDTVKRSALPMSDGKRKIVSWEAFDLDELKHFFHKPRRCNEACLRVIHVQNAPWARDYLLKRFNWKAWDPQYQTDFGTDFGRWVKYDKPQSRGGRPFVNGKTFLDPWSNTTRIGFGMDYLKPYACADPRHVNPRLERAAAYKMMELNCYDESDNPNYGYDVYVQRISVFVQSSNSAAATGPQLQPIGERATRNSSTGRNSNSSPAPSPARNSEPRNVEQRDNEQRNNEQRNTEHYDADSGNIIIIFEHSQTDSVFDTVIPARTEIEARWRKLPQNLPDDGDDEILALKCIDIVLQDVFKAVARIWEQYLMICSTHVSILEEKIYETPADESRAPELWTNQSLWLKVEKLMLIHQDIIKEMQEHLDLLSYTYEPQDVWLKGVLGEFEKQSNTIQEDLVKPTTSLSDLMYQSVSIRDSRHSIQMGESMWRLSWITFIFLPLTFIVGFFGMNVDTFQSDPSIKWYFVVAVPMMVCVLVFYYVLKRMLTRIHQTPYQRGIYEHLYHDLADEHPRMWSRQGPINSVQPVGFWNTIKWRLLQNWFAPEKTIRYHRDPDSDGDSGLGLWNHIQRKLARRWLQTLKIATSSDSIAETGQADTDIELEVGHGVVTELVASATLVGTVEAEPPSIAPDVDLLLAHRLSPPPTSQHKRTSSGGSSNDRPGSASSGLLIDEVDQGDPNHQLDPEERRRILIRNVLERLQAQGGTPASRQALPSVV